MMDSERGNEIHIKSNKEDMETLVLDDDSPTSKSFSSYRSAMTTLAESNHPLAAEVVSTPADTDPLLRADSYTKRQSYLDVTIGSLNGDNGVESPNGDSADEEPLVLSRSPSSSSSSSNSNYLRISVSSPQKEADLSRSNSIVPGANTYVTYLIATKTNLPDYGGTEFTVRRRFRDVVTLSDRLSEGYRGFFIPPRPDKNVVESQVMHKQEFVEQRRLGLEKYLRRLADHPVLRQSDELRMFLKARGNLPLPTSTDMASRMLDGAVNLPKQLFGDSANVIAPQDVVQPAKGGRDLLRIFKEMKQSVTNDWMGSKPLVNEEDKDFLESKERLHDLEQQLSNASKQAEILVKAQQDLGETMGALGLAFIKLTKFENQEAVLDTQRTRAADMKNVAAAAVKTSRFYRGLNSHTVKHLDTLHDQMGLMLAVRSAFSDRSSALLTVQTLVSEISSLHSRAGKLESAASKMFSGDKSRNQKLQEMQEAIRSTEDAKQCAIREYERIKENNKIEIERLDKERKADFLNMLKGFVTSQVSYSEKIANEWTKVANETSSYAKERE